MAEETEEEFEVISTGNINEGVPYIELDAFSYQIETSEPATGFAVIDGVFPESLTLSSGGMISGDLTEMDNYVPEFQPPPDFEFKIDGSHYCTYGSCQAGGYKATFTVEGTDGTDSDTSTLDIDIINNWSSDRDQMVRDMTEEFGTLDFDGKKKFFEINGDPATAEEYLTYMKAQGLYGD